MTEEEDARRRSGASGSGHPETGGVTSGPSGGRDSGSSKPEARRRPGRLRRWLVRPLIWFLVLLLVVVSGALIYISSEGFERRVETLVERRASEALGRSVRLEGLDLHLLSLSAVASGLRVDGVTPDHPPVLTSRRVTVDLSLLDLSVWGGEPTGVRLEELILEEPRFELSYGEDGASNLPDLPSGGGGGGVEIQLGRLSVYDGVFVYDEQRVPLHLDARGVRGWLAGKRGGEGPYRARISAATMATALPGLEPFSPAVTLEGRIHPDRLDLVAGTLEAAEFRTDLSGRVRWRERVEVHLDVKARVGAVWAHRLGLLEVPVEGSVELDGGVDWTSEGWRYGGRLRSERVEWMDLRVEEIRGRLDGGAEGLRVEIASARHAGGSLEGAFVLDLTEEGAADGGGGGGDGDGDGDGWPARLEVRAEDLALRRLLNQLGLELQGAAGRVSADLRYAFSTASIWKGDGGGRVDIRGVRRPSDPLELQGEAPVRIRRGVLRVAGARLTASAQSATADVVYDLDRRTGAVRYRLDTEDLPELASILRPELAARSEPVPPWWPRRGRGLVAGTLDLGPDRTLGRLTFDLTEVATEDLAVDRLTGSFEHDPERLGALELRAERGGGELWVTGEVGLGDETVSRLSWDLEIGSAGWPVATLGPLVPGFQSLEGGLNGRLSLGGTFEEPVVDGTLWAEPLRWGAHVVDRAEVELAWAARAGRIERLVLVGPPGRLTGFGTLDLETGDLDARLEASELILERSETVADLAGRLEGTVTLEATLGGTLDRPSVHLRLRGGDLALGGRPLGRGGTADLAARWEDERLEARGSLLGLMSFEGGGPLGAETAGLDFRVESSRIGEILDLLVEVDHGLEGSLEGTLRVSGTGEREGLGDLRGRLELSDLTLTYEDRRIRNLQPVVAEIGTDSLDVTSFFLGDPATGSELFLAGTVGLDAEDFPLDLRLQTSLDSAWFEPLVPELQISGALDALATVQGSLTAPRLNGQGELRGAQAIVPGFPHSLDAVSAIVFFYPEQVVLQQLNGRFASGRVRMTGRMDMPRGSEPLRYELQTTARGLTLRYPEGWTLRGDGDLVLRAPADGGGRELGGTVRLDRAFYVRDVPVGLFQVLQGFLRRQRLVLQETDEVLATTRLSVSIQGEEALRVRNNVANLSGDVSLSLQGTLARPVLFGQVEIERGGRLEFRDAEYEVGRGLVTFANPYEIEPVIDLVATTEVRQYDIQLTLSGTLDRLNANFSSSPPLADLEIVGLLTTGSTPEGPAGQQQAAESFLFGQAASAISRRVNTLFGFDEFRISPGTGGEVGGGIGLTVEKRLSRDVTVIFARDPTMAEAEVVQVAWDVTDGVTLILTREGDGSFALDARWERSF